MEGRDASQSRKRERLDGSDGKDESKANKRGAAIRQDIDAGCPPSTLLVKGRQTGLDTDGASAMSNGESQAFNATIHYPPQHGESSALHPRGQLPASLTGQVSFPPAQAQGPVASQANANALANEFGGWNSLMASSNIPAAFPSSFAIGGNASALSMLQLASIIPGSDANSILQALARSQIQPGTNMTQLILQAASGNNSTRNLLNMLCQSNPATGADSLATMLRNSGSNPAYLAGAPASPTLSTTQLINAAGIHQALQNASGPPNLMSLQHLFAQSNSQPQPYLPSNSPCGMSSSSSEPQQASLPRSSNNDVAITDNVLRSMNSSKPPKPSSDDSILLYKPADDTKLSPYQCLARQQLEFFEVGTEHLEAGAQGRNRPIKMGQVGIRCKWCAHLPHRQKQRASTYYPAKLTGVYQTAQNITNSHLMQLCQCVPDDIRHDLRLLQSKKSGTGGGRNYWTKAAGGCGIEEVDGGGLKLKKSQERGGGHDDVKPASQSGPEDKALKTDS